MVIHAANNDVRILHIQSYQRNVAFPLLRDVAAATRVEWGDCGFERVGLHEELGAD